MTSTRHFVFLEFINPDVNFLLTELRYALGGKRQSSPVHITVRGPYKERPLPAMLEKKAENLRDEFVFLADPGMFKTPNGYVVYLTAISRIFDSGIWWKPDFKNERKTPHVTLFETSDKDVAINVMDFLRLQHIEITTGLLALSIYTSKQQQLLHEKDAARVPIPATSRHFEKILAPTNLVKRVRDFYLELSTEEARPALQLVLV